MSSSILLRVVAVMTAGVCLVPLARARTQGPDTTPAYRLEAVMARLYLNQRDSLSANVIDNPNAGRLFNTPFGGGYLKSPSDEMLVTIEISGKPGSYASGRRLALGVTKDRGEVLLDRSVQIGILSDEGKFYATFLVYGTGCDPLHLRAQILGQTTIPASVIEKDIPFQCGE